MFQPPALHWQGEGMFLSGAPILGMHIMEGALPLSWSVIWGLLALPFLGFGIRSIERQTGSYPNLKLLLAMAAAFSFVLSALKMPSVTGSCSHPTGVALGAILFGPTPMAVMGAIVLIFQALLLAHGGLTTLGANVCSMAIAGPIIAYAVFYSFRKVHAPLPLAVGAAAALSDLGTYVVTSFQLALAFPDPSGGIAASAAKFLGIFAVTQIPLAIVEGLLTVVVFNLLMKYSAEEMNYLGIIAPSKKVEEASIVG